MDEDVGLATIAGMLALRLGFDCDFRGLTSFSVAMWWDWW